MNGPDSPASTDRLMEEIVARENLKDAVQRVKANNGRAGVDGMTIGGITDLKQHWPAIRVQLLNGTYEPKPVRRVEIPKPDGGVRQLGIPTVLDRFIQQAVLQVLQRRWDRTFSQHSSRREFFSSSSRREPSIRGRQRCDELRPAFRRLGGRQRPSVQLDDALRDRQAEPGGR